MLGFGFFTGAALGEDVLLERVRDQERGSGNIPGLEMRVAIQAHSGESLACESDKQIVPAMLLFLGHRHPVSN
jgi:hypothetical protein